MMKILKILPNLFGKMINTWTLLTKNHIRNLDYGIFDPFFESHIIGQGLKLSSLVR